MVAVHDDAGFLFAQDLRERKSQGLSVPCPDDRRGIDALPVEEIKAEIPHLIV